MGGSGTKERNIIYLAQLLQDADLDSLLVEINTRHLQNLIYDGVINSADLSVRHLERL